jgi:hypothetical protein
LPSATQSSQLTEVLAFPQSLCKGTFKRAIRERGEQDPATCALHGMNMFSFAVNGSFIGVCEIASSAQRRKTKKHGKINKGYL